MGFATMKYISILFLLITNLSHAISSPKLLRDKYLDNYLEQYLAQLFYPHHKYSDVSAIKKIVEKSIRSTPEMVHYTWAGWGYEKSYPLDFIEQTVRSGILDWIKNRSEEYACSSGHAKSLAKKIAQRIYDHLFSIMAYGATLDQGIFAHYIGKHLRAVVIEQAQQLRDRQPPINAFLMPVISMPSPTYCYGHKNVGIA